MLFMLFILFILFMLFILFILFMLFMLFILFMLVKLLLITSFTILLRFFMKKVFVKFFAKFTGKHMCWSLFLNKVAGLTGLRILENKEILGKSQNFMECSVFFPQRKFCQYQQKITDKYKLNISCLNKFVILNKVINQTKYIS